MSETNQPAHVPDESLTSEPSEDVTQNPLQAPPPPAPDASQEAPDGGGDQEQEDPAEAARRAERRREAARIGYLTKQRYAERAAREQAEKRAADLEARIRNLENPNQPPDERWTQEQIDKRIDELAEQKAAFREHQVRVDAWEQAGNETFGQQKFREACKVVADLASEQQRQILLAVAVDTEGGQRAIMEMADDPDQAEQILGMPPHRMALALAKLGAPKGPAAAARQAQQLPPPIRPPQAGRPRGEPDPERGGMDQFFRWSSKQPWKR